MQVPASRLSPAQEQPRGEESHPAGRTNERLNSLGLTYLVYFHPELGMRGPTVTETKGKGEEISLKRKFNRRANQNKVGGCQKNKKRKGMIEFWRSTLLNF